MLDGVERAIQCLDQNPEDRKLSKSLWSLHQHLEHLCLTGRSTPLLIQSAFDTTDGPLPASISTTLFNRGAIPRGETQAPDFGLPRGMAPKKMRNGFIRLRQTLSDLCHDEIKVIEHCGRSLHPALGGLTPAQWVTFIGMHFSHHLQIISDELRAP